MQEWKTTPEGAVKVQPMLSWQTAAIPEGGLLQIQYADSLEDITEERRKAVQIGLTPKQARELGQALLQIADTDGGPS
jgi:hypothetical protein